VTSDNRDSASRLSDALDELFERRTPPPQDDTDPTGLDAPDEGVVGDDALVTPVESPEPQSQDDSSPRSLAPESVPPEPPVSLPPAAGESSGPYVLPPIVLATESTPEQTAAWAPVVAPDPSTVTESIPTVPRVASVVAPPTTAATTSPPTSWGDHMPVVTAPPAGELRAAGRRPRVRRVTRVIRHVDPWSVFKVGLIFSIVMYVVLLSSGVLLWRVAESTGSLDNVERWFTQFGWETFEFKGDELFRNAWIIGLFGVVAMTGGLVLLATLFNLVSDIVGGVRVTVLEEEVVERTMSNARRYVVRRSVDAGNTGAVPSAWSVDDDEPLSSAATQVTEVAVPAPPSSDWSADD
jgi:hypothetical protein